MTPATFTVADNAASDNLRPDEACVGQIPLSDYEREVRIEHFGQLIEFYMANARRARLLRDCLIASRTPEQVARMEEALGLDMPACANEERA